MSAFSEDFPWQSYKGNFNFLEKIVSSHSNVSCVLQVKPHLFMIKTAFGELLKAFICDCYYFTKAEYQEVLDEIGEVNLIIVCSQWCGYSMECKISLREKQVGLYKPNELMAALNIKDYWKYLNEFQVEHFKEHAIKF